MKSRIVVVGIIILLLVAAVITNPSEEVHKEALKLELKKGLSKALNSQGLSSDNFLFNTITKDLYEDIVWTQIVEKGIKRKSYYFFSASEIEYLGKSYTAGVGLFSRVYIFPQVEKQVTNRINELINEGGGLRNLLK